jgi:hypothetical protein
MPDMMMMMMMMMTMTMMMMMTMPLNLHVSTHQWGHHQTSTNESKNVYVQTSLELHMLV